MTSFSCRSGAGGGSLGGHPGGEPTGSGGPLKVWNKHDFAQTGFMVLLEYPYPMNSVPGDFLGVLV